MRQRSMHWKWVQTETFSTRGVLIKGNTWKTDHNVNGCDSLYAAILTSVLLTMKTEIAYRPVLCYQS